MQTLALFGDSITAGVGDDAGGWVSRLAAIPGWPAPQPVARFAVSGATTADLLATLVADLAGVAGAAPVCVIAIGLNDLHPLNRAGRSLDQVLSRYRQQLETITRAVTIRGGTALFVELTPVEETAPDPFTGQPGGAGRSNADIAAMNAVLGDHCRRHGLTLIPINERIAAAGVDRMLGDGIHPNPAGHRLIAEAVAPVLAAVLRAPIGRHSGADGLPLG